MILEIYTCTPENGGVKRCSPFKSIRHNILKVFIFFYMSSKSLKQYQNGQISKTELDQRIKQSSQTKRSSGAPLQRTSTNMPRIRRRMQQRARAALGVNVPNPIRSDTPRNMDSPQIQTGVRSPIANYGQCLSDPKNFMMRIPDAYPNATALFRSVGEWNINTTFFPAETDPNGDASGRFSVNVQPTLGGFGSVSSAKVSIVPAEAYLTEGGQPPDWTLSSSYITKVGNKDPRIDPFYSNMTQGAPFALQVTKNGGQSPTKPFGTATTPTESGYGFTMPYDPFLGLFQVSPGNYLFTITLVGTSLESVTAEFTSPSSTTTNFGVSGASTDGTQVTVQFAASVSNPGDTMNITAPGGGSVTGAVMTVSPYFNDTVPLNPNNGSIQRIRPVAMSVLFTFQAAALTNGGQVAGAYVPGDTCMNNYYTNNPGSQLGNLQYTNNLAQVKGALNGPIKKGIYIWWAPEKISDIDMYTPSDMNNHEYPCLTISGQMTQSSLGGTLPYTLLVGRLEVVTVYEFTTIMTLYESITTRGFTDFVEQAWHILSDQQHVFENPDHFKWIKEIGRRLMTTARAVGSIAYQNRDVLMPVAKQLAMLAI